MEFGVSYLPDSNPQQKNAMDYYHDILSVAEYADELGYAYCKMTEHYLNAYGGYCPDPLMFLSSVAQRTRRIRLMTGCIIPAFSHPIAIAARTAMLDVISGGRLDVGLARGYMPYEFKAFSVDMDSSRQCFEEAAELIQALWTGDAVTFQGQYYTLQDCVSYPRPIQMPHPPLWGAAVRSRESFAWLAEHDYNLLVGLADLERVASNIEVFKNSLDIQNVGFKPKVFISLPVLVRENDSQALEEASAQLEIYLRTWATAADSWANTQSRAYRGYRGMAQGLRAGGVRSLLDGALVGSPESCIAQIERMISLCPIDGILMQVDFGSASLRSMLTTVELVASQVAPRFASGATREEGL